YLESTINNSEEEKPTNSSISNHDLEQAHLASKKYEDKCLNINELTYTNNMFTYIMKDFCMEDADLITICIGNFENVLLGIDKSKRGHKIDAAIGICLMNEHLIQFLIVESKKPGTDP
ncbi:2643_t:CDS:2, partial [Dentiscutata erythropus]